KLAVLPTSVHLILNGLVGVVLGRRAPLAVAVGLTLQYLLLSHGGLTTLGINTCIVALPALAGGGRDSLLARGRGPALARPGAVRRRGGRGRGRAELPGAPLRRKGRLAGDRETGAARTRAGRDRRGADARRAGELFGESEAGDARFPS